MEMFVGFYEVLLNFKEFVYLVFTQGLYFRFQGALLLFWIILFLFLWVGRMIWLEFKTSRLMDVSYAWSRRIFTGIARLGAIALVIVVIADPYSVAVTQKPVWKGETLDFVFDQTPSQNAEDILPRRMEALKKDIIETIDKLSGAGLFKICLGSFTSSFNRELECTEELETVKETISRLDVVFPSEGTNLLAAFPFDYALMRREGINSSPNRINLFVLTDGGREMWIDRDGVLRVQEEDWNEGDLKALVVKFVQDGVRVIPVGVGGSKPVPVYIFDSAGHKSEVKNSKGDTIYTKLDESIIKKIALWAGSPEKFFIFQQGTSLADWISKNVIKDLEVDHYITEKNEKYWWRYPLVLGIILASFSLGAFNWIARFWNRLLFKKKII